MPSFRPPEDQQVGALKATRSARCKPRMRPKRGRIVSAASMVASSAGHSPPAIAGPVGPAARSRASADRPGLRPLLRTTRFRPGRASPPRLAWPRAAGVAPRRRHGPSGRRRRLRGDDQVDDRRRSAGCRTSSPDSARSAYGPSAGEAAAEPCDSRRRVASEGWTRQAERAGGCFRSARRSTGAKPASTAVTRARSRWRAPCRPAGRPIVDLDLPAPQFGGDAARQGRGPASPGPPFVPASRA